MESSMDELHEPSERVYMPRPLKSSRCMHIKLLITQNKTVSAFVVALVVLVLTFSIAMWSTHSEMSRLQNEVAKFEAEESSPTSDSSSTDDSNSIFSDPTSTMKLIVATGSANTTIGVTNAVEIVDLFEDRRGQRLACFNLPDFRHNLTEGTGGLLYGNVPVICGGLIRELKPEVVREYKHKLNYYDLEYHPQESMMDSCYAFIRGSWIETSKMISPRRNASSIVTHNDQALFIVGGVDENKDLKTTEYVTIGNSIPGPDLPDERSSGCLAQVNATHAILLCGGKGTKQNRSYFKATLYYSIPNQSWKSGPEILVGRDGCACGVVQDSEDPNTKYVVITGGETMTNDIATTEIHRLGSDGFVEGPNLPDTRFNRGLTIISSRDKKSLIMFGGYSKDVKDFQSKMFRIQCAKMRCHWEPMGHSLKLPRTNSVTMAVPNSLVRCEKSAVSNNTLN